MQRWMNDLLGRDDWCGREVSTIRKEIGKDIQAHFDQKVLDVMLGKTEDKDPEVPATALWAI